MSYDLNSRADLADVWPAEEPADIHVAITGAAGRIGYSLVFRIAAGALFGPDQPLRLSLLETADGMSALRGVGLELRDAAFPLLRGLVLTDQPLEAFAKADWIIMLAGNPVMTSVVDRRQLLERNAPIYAQHGAAINQTAPNARMLVVANPCNTNCLVALRHAPNVPASHWSALNRVDGMRAAAMIAEKADVPVTQVNRVTVWGNHSERVFVDFHNTFIGEVPAHQLISDHNWVRQVLEPTVQQRARQIFELRQSTPSASTAQAILGTIHCLSVRTPLNRRFGTSVVSDGSYGVRKGTVFGMPLRTEDGQSWFIVPDLYLDEYAQQKLAENAQELESEAAFVGL